MLELFGNLATAARLRMKLLSLELQTEFDDLWTYLVLCLYVMVGAVGVTIMLAFALCLVVLMLTLAVGYLAIFPVSVPFTAWLAERYEPGEPDEEDVEGKGPFLEIKRLELDDGGSLLFVERAGILPVVSAIEDGEHLSLSVRSENVVTEERT